MDFLVSIQDNNRIVVTQAGGTWQTHPLTNGFPNYDLVSVFKDVVGGMRAMVSLYSPFGLTSMLPPGISEVKDEPTNGLGLYADGTKVILRHDSKEYVLHESMSRAHVTPLFWITAQQIMDSPNFTDPAKWYEIFYPEPVVLTPKKKKAK